MDPVEKAYEELRAILRPASVAQIGGFRPPESKAASWFGGQGVGLEGERLPQYNGRDMFCLLQIKVSELPYVPVELDNTAFLAVFFNREEIPFDKPHGEGWLIREYPTCESLVELSVSDEPAVVKDFPVRWSRVEDDAPDWENAWDLIDLKPINDADDERFFEEFNRYEGTKVGGFPNCIQHGTELDGFVFQIGSEEKPGWNWADNGIAYFNRNETGDWTFRCQFY